MAYSLHSWSKPLEKPLETPLAWRQSLQSWLATTWKNKHNEGASCMHCIYFRNFLLCRSWSCRLWCNGSSLWRYNSSTGRSTGVSGASYSSTMYSTRYEGELYCCIVTIVPGTVVRTHSVTIISWVLRVSQQMSKSPNSEGKWEQPPNLLELAITNSFQNLFTIHNPQNSWTTYQQTHLVTWPLPHPWYPTLLILKEIQEQGHGITAP